VVYKMQLEIKPLKGSKTANTEHRRLAAVWVYVYATCPNSTPTYQSAQFVAICLTGKKREI